MGLQKNGIMVDCAHCSCASSDASGCFDVVVPISDAETGIIGNAKLHCVISAESHGVELVEWQGVGNCPDESMQGIRDRLLTALDFVADQRICGNSRICPAEVVRIVKALD